MNAYYQRANRTVLVTDAKPLNINIGEKIISFICAIISVLTCDTAVIIEKISLSAVCFIAFIGVIGGIDAGSISMLAGIPICAAISLIECLVLRSLIKKKKASK